MNNVGYQVHDIDHYINVGNNPPGTTMLPPISRASDFDRGNDLIDMGSSRNHNQFDLNGSRQLSLAGGGILGAAGNSILSSGSQQQPSGAFNMQVYTPDKY
jgi:hypothetical protein